MMHYLVISQCLVEEQSCSTPVDTSGDNDIHDIVCRFTVMYHIYCITCMVGLAPISKWLYMVAVTGSMHKSIYRSSGSSWFGLFVSQLDRLQSVNIILHSSVIFDGVDFVNSHTIIRECSPSQSTEIQVPFSIRTLVQDQQLYQGARIGMSCL